jgi:hypothetical protein
LEDELTRYRRQRAGLSVAPIVLRPKQLQKKALDLMSFGAETETEVTPATPETSPKAISFDLGTRAIVEPSLEHSAMIPYEPETAGQALFELAQEPGEQTPPDDYLESSEHLLKSLKREEAKVEVERGFLQSLSTPLGIGSMLTLLVSSAMLGYVIMNPSILSGMMQTARQPEATDSGSEVASGSIPNSPPLDQDEFSDLGLDTLSVVRTKPAAIATIAPTPTQSAPVASPTPTQSAPTAFVAPSAAPVAPSPIASSSVLLPSITVPKTVNPAPPANSQSLQYKVEIPFTGDRSLEAARQVVPDAFVRSDGKIQLAATLTQSDAQKKAQELKNRGIAAEIRQP